MELFIKNLMLGLYVFLYALFNVIGVSILKSQLSSESLKNTQSYLLYIFSGKVLIGLLLIFISMFFALKVLSFKSILVANPLFVSGNFLITILVSILYFNNSLTIFNLIGMVLIIVGVIFISY